MIIFKKLPNELIERINFNELFSHKPSVPSKVLIYDRDKDIHIEKEIYRGYKCFMNTPEFDPNVKKSFMFLNKENDIPEAFNKFVEFAKRCDKRYNQMVVNFYDKDDYIELHRDCSAKFINSEAPILMLNLNESDNIYNLRQFTMVNIQDSSVSSVPLLNNNYYYITNNTTHRHCVGKGVEKRISITFRMIKE